MSLSSPFSGLRRVFTVSLFALLAVGRAAVFSADDNTLHVWDFSTGDVGALTDGKAGLELKPGQRGGPLRWVRSARGNALVFGGDLRMQTSKNESAGLADRAITIECWLRIAAAPGRVAGVVEQLDYAGKTGYRLAIGPDGQVRWVVLDSAAEQVSSSKQRLAPGEWTHVAVTYNGQTMNIYVNGVLDSRKPLASGALDASARPFVVGFYTDSSAQGFFKGEIEALRISKTARTEFKLN